MDNQTHKFDELESHGSGLMDKLWSLGSCHQSLPGSVWSGKARARQLAQQISTMPCNCEALRVVDDYYVSVVAAYRNQQAA
ncbi:MAG TPA: hypothetical protein V6C81_32175 [Planktothrix sp.]|jgi:hypothetical protein